MDYPQNLTESDRYWYDLILKCRTSGKSDHQWLKENSIKAPTFYYHVKQLRKKACELPEAAKRTSVSASKDDVVRLSSQSAILSTASFEALTEYYAYSDSNTYNAATEKDVVKGCK